MQLRFTDEQQDKILKFIKDRRGGLDKCLVCNGNNGVWFVTPAYTQFNMTMNLSAGMSITVGGDVPGSIPAVGIMCPNCRHLMFFNIPAEVIG